MKKIELEKLELGRYVCPTEVKEYILSTFKARVIFTENIYDYFCGSKYVKSAKSKNYIYTDGKIFVLQECVLNWACIKLGFKSPLKEVLSWRQIVLDADDEIIIPEKSITGSYAWNYIIKILKNKYTEDEITETFNSHSVPEDENKKQYNFKVPVNNNELVIYNNTRYYDINGAHANAVIKLFPKSKDDLMNVYNLKEKYKAQGKTAEANRIKAYFNFFVGMLCRKGYRGTYNYIVQQTTDCLLSKIKEVGGQLLYANTDSLIVNNPKVELPQTKELGEFKLESTGTLYIYKDTHYRIMQYTNVKGKIEYKGNVPLVLRKHIDLSVNKTIKYDLEREYIGTDINGRIRYSNNIKNLQEIYINENSIKNMI